MDNRITGVVNNIVSHYKGNGYGFIKGDDGVSYYFDNKSILDDEIYIDDFEKGDEVIFEPSNKLDDKGRGKAYRVEINDNTLDGKYKQSALEKAQHEEKRIIGADGDVDGSSAPIDDLSIENEKIDFSEDNTITNEQDGELVEDGIIKFYKPGFAKYLDREDQYSKHLKSGSGEDIILDKLSKILFISRLGSHLVVPRSNYEFCLARATRDIKQFIRGTDEFLIVFSYFYGKEWQEKTYSVEREIRRRKEIADRRPMVNFYILISNANNLLYEINRKKGSSGAAIIPFTFDEILKTKDRDELLTLVISRFSEYYYENNMLGDTSAIDEDLLLFGDRGKIADSIVNRCEQGKNSGIFGLRRSGKTSVLNAVCRRLDRAGIKYVFIQSRSLLEHIDSWKSALYEIARQIRIVTSGMVQKETETRKQFEERLALNSTREDYDTRATGYFVEDVKLYCRDIQTFVIAIDEVELITYNTASSSTWDNVEAYTAFWGALRDCSCSLIVCGVNSTINEVNTIRFGGKPGDNPMYGRLIISSDSYKTYLPSFTDEQTKEMINILGGYSNIDFSNVYSEINREFGGQPYAIRQFCSFVFEKIKHLRQINKKYVVSKATVIGLLKEFSNSPEGDDLCSVTLQHVQIFADEYAMLKKLALSPEKYRTLEGNEIQLIDHLCKYGLIEYDYGTHYVVFRLNIIRDYICRTHNKDPKDMDNEERREYIQAQVAELEAKMKSYIYNYYTLTAMVPSCRNYFVTKLNTSSNVIKINKSYGYSSDPKTCPFKEFFDHKKYIIYFSSLTQIYKDNWNDIGRLLRNAGISKGEFEHYMKNLNAGRTDADHYDAEDVTTYPDGWIISDDLMNDFVYALKKIKLFTDQV